MQPTVRPYNQDFWLRVCREYYEESPMNEFRKDNGLIHEAIVSGCNDCGPEIVQSIFEAFAHTKGFWAKVVALLAPVFRLMPVFDRDMTAKKWELLADRSDVQGDFTPELVEFLKDEEDYVIGEKMIKGTESEDNAGQRHAEAMLREQEKIPEEWRKYVMVFTKTVWRGPYSYWCVAFLYWYGRRWCLDFDWLENDFYRSYRVVRLRK